MRIAVSGVHRTGKTTLVEALAERLPGHAAVPEPYHLLEERGYAFEHPPSVEDYVAQMRASLGLLRRRAPNAVFDRCPLDFLGYILATRGGERFDAEPWRAPIAATSRSLDLLVFVRADPAHDPPVDPEEAAFRFEVDGWLRDIVEADDLDLCADVPVLALDGPWALRLDAVLARLGQE